MSINIAEIRELLLAIAQTQITEVNLKTDTFDLSVKQGTVQGEVTYTTVRPAIASPPPVSIPSESTVSASPVISSKPEGIEAPISPVSQQKWVEITAPMVGTFYRAPSPDDPSYVNVNDVIRTGQVVCIVEAMKLMNEIESEISGKVMEILVENGEPVEYGQTLMWVNPD